MAENWVLSFCFLFFFCFVLLCFFVFFGFLVLLAIAEKNNNELENKKPKNQETTPKNKTAHPKGGSSGRELGLVTFLFLFFSVWFFWFLVFLFSWFLVFGFWFCLAIAEKPNRNYRNCQWLQSSERTMAHVQCQWF